jgi:hypothetical protein
VCVLSSIGMLCAICEGYAVRERRFEGVLEGSGCGGVLENLHVAQLRPLDMEIVRSEVVEPYFALCALQEALHLPFWA